jgi:hypothetical protein
MLVLRNNCFLCCSVSSCPVSSVKHSRSAILSIQPYKNGYCLTTGKLLFGVTTICESCRLFIGRSYVVENKLQFATLSSLSCRRRQIHVDSIDMTLHVMYLVKD